LVLGFLIQSLKKTYPKFYQRERNRILRASVMIIMAILGRIVFNILIQIESISSAMNESTRDNTWLFPSYELSTRLLGTIFPLASMLYSLKYMFS
jgi:hypothetical protein